MNYLGIDYGEKRIGLSCGDDDVRLAVPIAAAVEPSFSERMEHIAELVRTRRISELVVGYPYNMDGSIGFKAKEVDTFIAKLEERFALPVHRTDERLTSSDAQNRMDEAGRGVRSRSKQTIRAKLAERKSGALDSRAAALILQDYLDSLPGADVSLFPGAELFAGDEPFEAGEPSFGEDMLADGAAPENSSEAADHGSFAGDGASSEEPAYGADDFYESPQEGGRRQDNRRRKGGNRR